mmetsp:Transcript_57868/g.135887  ORF Transcript_57868/g.135887 Transcript_57868/m.135887 type:complete len:352 (-) Transcript_57868:2010-3065(-)
MAYMENQTMTTMMTLNMAGMLDSRHTTAIFRPGLRLMTRSGRRARSARRALSDLRLSPLPNELKSETATMAASRTFHGFLRYACLCATRPSETIFKIISTRKKRVKTTSMFRNVSTRFTMLQHGGLGPSLSHALQTRSKSGSFSSRAQAICSVWPGPRPLQSRKAGGFGHASAMMVSSGRSSRSVTLVMKMKMSTMLSKCRLCTMNATHFRSGLFVLRQTSELASGTCTSCVTPRNCTCRVAMLGSASDSSYSSPRISALLGTTRRASSIAAFCVWLGSDCSSLASSPDIAPILFADAIPGVDVRPTSDRNLAASRFAGVDFVTVSVGSSSSSSSSPNPWRRMEMNRFMMM